MFQQIQVELPGAIKTKKNHPTLVMGRAVVLPSPHYLKWLKEQLASKIELKQLVGPAAPVTGLVAVEAHFYLDRNVGDLLSYEEALADAIQSDVWQCSRPTFRLVDKIVKNARTGTSVVKKSRVSDCAKKFPSEASIARCPKCDYPMPKLSRRGLGLIVDDRQIKSWDGSRLHVDRENPRVEFTIRPFVDNAAQPEQESLFEEELEQA